jgi:nucleoside-diphosphate-sugar epimerase
LKGEKFTCFLSEHTYLPMMYMDDAIQATLQLMDAPKEKITIRTSYNIAGLSFSPAEIYQSIVKHYSNFEIEYQSDFRQAIADSWPNSIDDSKAKVDWGWKPKFNLEAMTSAIITNLPKYFNF